MFNSETGRSVMVAFDHGTEGAVRGGEDFPKVLEAIVDSPADAVLLTTGAARHYVPVAKGKQAPAALLAGLDIPIFGARIGSGAKLIATRQPWHASDAAAVGAQCCKALLPMGLSDIDEWANALERIGANAMAASQIGLPFMVEPAFWGPEAGDGDKAILDAARLSVELGADLLKVPGPRDSETLANLVKWSPVPVLVLGGTPRDGSDFLQEVIHWINAGADGVVVGRNVWNRPNPSAAIEALSIAVHEGDLHAARTRMADAGDPMYSAALFYDKGEDS